MSAPGFPRFADGIDVFFDNVGGVVLNEVLARLRLRARIVLCGAISRYNEATPPPGPANYSGLIGTRSRMEGFIILDYAARFAEAIGDLASWMAAEVQAEGRRGDRAGQVDREPSFACSPARISENSC